MKIGDKQSPTEEKLQQLLINDRKQFWTYIQNKVLKFLQATNDIISSMNLYEIADLVVIINKFIEIGREFSDQASKSQIQEYFDSIILKEFISQMREQELAKVKNYMDNDEWKRLPLANDYKVKELDNPFKGFVKNRDQALSVFIGTQQKQANFAHFGVATTPFDKIKLIGQYSLQDQV